MFGHILGLSTYGFMFFPGLVVPRNRRSHGIPHLDIFFWGLSLGYLRRKVAYCNAEAAATAEAALKIAFFTVYQC